MAYLTIIEYQAGMSRIIFYNFMQKR